MKFNLSTLKGCDSGFGSRLAEELDRHGFQVFAGCLNTNCDGAQQLKQNCSERLHLVQLNVTVPVQIASAVSLVQTSLGHRSIQQTLEILLSILNQALVKSLMLRFVLFCFVLFCFVLFCFLTITKMELNNGIGQFLLSSRRCE